MARYGGAYPWKWYEDRDKRVPGERVDWSAVMKEEGEAFEKLLAASEALPTGQLVGRLLRLGRGDGYAWYIITSEKPLTLQWVPYSDAWQIEGALIRGLRIADVQAMVRREQAISELFRKTG